MKIWFDLTNSPHVNFFAGMIRELEKDHDVLLTCRPLANTTELLEMSGFPHHVVGRHYGQSSINKAAGFGIRIMQLYRFLKKHRIDAAISHSSFYSPVVARMLGIPSIYLNDNEHAGGNKISFRFADRIMVPEFLDLEKVRRQGARADKIISYPGVKEGVYLWDYKPSSNSDFLPDKGEKQVVFVRPEPWAAQYYTGKRNFIDDLLVTLKDRYVIVLLPRGADQMAHYKQPAFNGIFIPPRSIRLEDIMGNCDLFIGAGGTMTREAAVLGIPTISIYQDALLDVDAYLLANGFMTHRIDLDAEYVIEFLEKNSKRPPDTRLLQKGGEAYKLIKSNLLEIHTMKKGAST
jgi:predicted glycosyltransferase